MKAPKQNTWPRLTTEQAIHVRAIVRRRQRLRALKRRIDAALKKLPTGAELAKTLGVSPSNISRAANDLIKRHIEQRHESAANN